MRTEAHLSEVPHRDTREDDTAQHQPQPCQRERGTHTKKERKPQTLKRGKSHRSHKGIAASVDRWELAGGKRSRHNNHVTMITTSQGLSLGRQGGNVAHLPQRRAIAGWTSFWAPPGGVLWRLSDSFEFQRLVTLSLGGLKMCVCSTGGKAMSGSQLGSKESCDKV